jgi:flavocytochrome c
MTSQLTGAVAADRTAYGDDSDVIVIGSGVAGLCAAIEAAEAGMSTLVLEAAPDIGGASVMSGAGCCLVGTPLQEAHGIQDSVELALADWKSFGGPTTDLDWARQYLANSRREVHDWVTEQLGITWTELNQPEGNSVPRWHLPSGWGRGIVGALVQRARSVGVRFRTRAEARALLTDGGAVRGVEVADEGGLETRRALAVIVCTGGFVNDHAMMLESAPHLRALPRLLCGGSPTAVGAGHRLLADVGAAFTCLDHIWIYPNGTPDPHDPAGLRGLGVRGITGHVWLNRDGHRFHDESLGGAASGTTALLRQPGQTAWCVFTATELPSLLLIDNEYYATPERQHPAATAEFWRRSAYAWQAQGPQALADAMGLPGDAVRASIDALNNAIAAGLPRDPLFGRDLAGMRPLTGSLAAIQYFPMAQKNFGGVSTDLQCRVLDKHFEPIEGLYAAGEVAGMAGGHINGRAALEGTMFGPCLYSGRVAGAYAAAYAGSIR